MTDVTSVISDVDRLAAVRRLLLLDTPPSSAFDRLTRMAARLLHVPIALLTLVDADRQWFKSAFGLPEPLASQRQTPLAYSLCQHVVATSRSLRIADAEREARWRDHPAVRDFGVRAYSGTPLCSPDGFPVGALCALDFVPRVWTDEDMANLDDLASIAMREIIAHLHERHESHRRTARGVRRGSV